MLLQSISTQEQTICSILLWTNLNDRMVRCGGGWGSCNYIMNRSYIYLSAHQWLQVLQPIHLYHLLQYTSALGYRPHRQDLIPIIMTTGMPSNQSMPSEPCSGSWLASEPAACCGMSIFNLSAARRVAYTSHTIAVKIYCCVCYPEIFGKTVCTRQRERVNEMHCFPAG